MCFCKAFPAAWKWKSALSENETKKFFSQRSGHQMNLSSKWKDLILFPLLLGSHTTKQMWYDFSCALPESEDKREPERPVNSSIIWCLSCLIKHIIDYPRTNDSHPITHEFSGFGITTTWPRCGLTGLRYRVRVYPLFTTVTLIDTAFPIACLWMWLSALPKTVGGKNAITARLSYCFRLTFLTEFMNIYESILHLNLEPPPPF